MMTPLPIPLEMTTLPTPTLPHRFEFLGILREGGMGRICRVRDRDADPELAHKQLILPDGPAVAHR